MVISKLVACEQVLECFNFVWWSGREEIKGAIVARASNRKATCQLEVSQLRHRDHQTPHVFVCESGCVMARNQVFRVDGELYKTSDRGMSDRNSGECWGWDDEK